MAFRQIIGRRMSLLSTFKQQRCFSSLIAGYNVNPSLLDRRRNNLSKAQQSPIYPAYFHPGIRLLSSTSTLFDIKKDIKHTSTSIETPNVAPAPVNASEKAGPILEEVS